MKRPNQFQIRPAHVEDVPIILQLIRDLATYERAPGEVTATEEQLVEVLFGDRPAAEVLLAFEGQSPVGFAVYFYNFSTWLGRPGLYLEDLFVKPEKRGKVALQRRSREIHAQTLLPVQVALLLCHATGDPTEKIARVENSSAKLAEGRDDASGNRRPEAQRDRNARARGRVRRMVVPSEPIIRVG